MVAAAFLTFCAYAKNEAKKLQHTARPNALTKIKKNQLEINQM